MSHVRMHRRRFSSGISWLPLVMWILGGVYGLWVGAMAARHYLGVDYLTPIETEVSQWVKSLNH